MVHPGGHPRSPPSPEEQSALMQGPRPLLWPPVYTRSPLEATEAQRGKGTCGSAPALTAVDPRGPGQQAGVRPPPLARDPPPRPGLPHPRGLTRLHRLLCPRLDAPGIFRPALCSTVYRDEGRGHQTSNDLINCGQVNEQCAFLSQAFSHRK